MKKLLVVMLIALALLAMAQSNVTATVGGRLEANYFMDMPAGDEIENSGFAVITTKLWTDVDFGSDLTGKLMLAVLDASNGINDATAISVEELWINKNQPFGVANFGMKFGKMEVASNLDIDNGITRSLTNMVRFPTPGPDGTWGNADDFSIYTPGEIDQTYGLGASYMVEGIGNFTLTTFEGTGGLDESNADSTKYEDEDMGLLSSLALQYDTKDNAFGVTGLRGVAAYVMIAGQEDLDTSSWLSLGATYEVMPGLVLGLELIPMVSNWNSPEDAGEMLYALNADYKIEGGYKVGLTYESYTINEFMGKDSENLAISRMALRGSMDLTDQVCLRGEYSQTTLKDSDIADASLDAIAHASSVASSLRVGLLGKF
ncbi:MAG: porin [Planctomycetota bacterium]